MEKFDNIVAGGKLIVFPGKFTVCVVGKIAAVDGKLKAKVIIVSRQYIFIYILIFQNIFAIFWKVSISFQQLFPMCCIPVCVCMCVVWDCLRVVFVYFTFIFIYFFRIKKQASHLQGPLGNNPFS